MSRIGVCDDNPILAKNIAQAVKGAFSKHQGVYEVESFANGSVLLDQNKTSPFDVLFLDIDMPNVSGFDIAKALREDFSHCFIVFVTSHAELVFESFDFQPFNFIRKTSSIPLEDSISPIVDKLVQHLKQDDKIIIEDDSSRKRSVFIRDIVYIESNGHHIIYSLQEREQINKVRVRGKMQDCEEQLSAYDFVRIHKGYLVNLKYITHIKTKSSEVELMQKFNLPLSKYYKPSVDEKYTKYLRTKV